MNSKNLRCNSSPHFGQLKESRSERFNLAIQHPSKWRFVLDLFLSAPMRVHRYRVMSNRMLEETIHRINCRGRT